MDTYQLSRRGRPGLTRAVTLVMQLVAGAALGLGTAYLGTLIGKEFFAGDPAGFGDIVAQIGGLLIGYPLGVALGIWLVGRLMRGGGALWATLLGAGLGVGAMLLSARLFVYQDVILGWVLIFSLGLIGALVGYYLSERRRVRG